MTNAITIRTGSTGRQLETGRAEAFGLDPDGQRWITCCTEHATLVGCSTKALAMSSDSIDFCDECRTEAGYGDDHKVDVPLELDDLVWIGGGDVTYRVARDRGDGTYDLSAINAANRPLLRRAVPLTRINPQGRKYADRYADR